MLFRNIILLAAAHSAVLTLECVEGYLVPKTQLNINSAGWKEFLGESLENKARSYQEGKIENAREFQKECSSLPWGRFKKIIPYKEREHAFMPEWSRPTTPLEPSLFDPLELIIAVSNGPLLSQDECSSLIDWAETADRWVKNFPHASASRQASMPDRVLVDSLPLGAEWLGPLVARRLAPALEKAFPEWPGARAHKLRLYQATVLRYDAGAASAAGQVGEKASQDAPAPQFMVNTPVHQDFSFLTLTIALNKPGEYSGGGTWLEPLQVSVKLQQGLGVAHAGRTWHGGHGVSAGTRYALSLFFHTTAAIEHGKRFQERAMGLVASSEIGCLEDAILELEFSLRAHEEDYAERVEADMGNTGCHVLEAQGLWGVLSELQKNAGLCKKSSVSHARFEEHITYLQGLEKNGRAHPYLLK